MSDFRAFKALSLGVTIFVVVLAAVLAPSTCVTTTISLSLPLRSSEKAIPRQPSSSDVVQLDTSKKTDLPNAERFGRNSAATS